MRVSLCRSNIKCFNFNEENIRKTLATCYQYPNSFRIAYCINYYTLQIKIPDNRHKAVTGLLMILTITTYNSYFNVLL